jgi:site-specific recombinase XerD
MMEVVYLFCESPSARGSVPEGNQRQVRVFIHGCNKRLFKLIASQGCTWDAAMSEFIFTHGINAENLSGIFPGIPCVRVMEKSSPDRLRVFGFLERPWEKNEYVSQIKKVDENRIGFDTEQPFAFPVMPSLPEKLSEQWRNKLEAALRSRKYSPRTQKAYIYYNRLICRTLQKIPEEIQIDDLTEFLAIMEKSKDYSASSINLAISAIKFFFKNVLKNDGISEHHRPRHDGRLPMVLSKDEIREILDLEKNPKHRLLWMLVYSSGLRVSEVVALKKEHIDLSRKVIYIRLGKGRKDRSTLLSERAASFIEEYCDFYGIEKWLFPGQPPTRPLTIRSAQHIFDKAIRRAGIAKKITIHGLRHTFATHLLESGTDIRYIQTLLGHANPATTERYTHVAKRSVLNIKSPLDSIL